MHSHALLYSLYANIFVLFAGRKAAATTMANSDKTQTFSYSKEALPYPQPHITYKDPTVHFWGKYKKRSAFTTQKANAQTAECVYKYIYSDSGQWESMETFKVNFKIGNFWKKYLTKYFGY